MNKKQLLPPALATKTLAAIFIVALLFSSSAVFAQVKIGTNPTTIDPVNNLEVQPTDAGKKFAIDKTGGKVTIADGSQGTNKVLTSDATGVATWQTPTAADVPVIFTAQFIGSAALFQPIPANTYTKANYTSSTIDKNGSFNLTSDQFVVPANGTGYYQISTSYVSVNKSHSLNTYQFLYVNGVSRRAMAFGNAPTGAGVTASGTYIVQLNAGDVVNFWYFTDTTDLEIYLSFIDVTMIAK